MEHKINITPETKKTWTELAEYAYRVNLNPILIKKQNLLQEDVGLVFGLHGQKIFLFNKARVFLQELAKQGTIQKTDKQTIEDFNSELELLEFSAQTAWKFNKDPSYHNWWLDMPGCTCPVMDNREREGIPTAGKIYSGDCPWHGWFDENKTEI